MALPQVCKCGHRKSDHIFRSGAYRCDWHNCNCDNYDFDHLDKTAQRYSGVRELETLIDLAAQEKQDKEISLENKTIKNPKYIGDMSSDGTLKEWVNPNLKRKKKKLDELPEEVLENTRNFNNGEYV